MHQLCLVHILRELIFCVDVYKSKKAIEIIRFISKVTKSRDHIWNEDFDKSIKKKVQKEYEKQLDKIIDSYDSIQEDEKQTRRIVKRLLKHREKILTFLYSKNTPFHNNSSEL